MRNVILTGFMGSGKTSVGKILCRVLGMEFVDLDAVVEERAGMTVSEIFARMGEAAFRDLESLTIADLVGTSGKVIATGGGAVIRIENRRLLRKSGIIINLKASVADIEVRLAHATDRPLLDEDRHARIIRLLAERESYYADADARIDTSGKKLEDVAAEVIDFLKMQGESWNG